MKKASILFLVIALLVIAVEEMLYFKRQRQQYDENARTAATMLFASTLRGKQKTLTLPDGSVVWLNAASTLAYSSAMASGDRTVELSGEAYFNVVARPSDPFTVRAKDMVVEVLGTRFNVRNYPDEVHSRTFVTSGAVRVRYHDQDTTLYAGDEADLDPTQLRGPALTLKKNVDTVTATGWTKGLLSFADADLPSLLRDLSRAYNIDIQLEGHVSDHHFQGTFSLQEPLEEVIERLVIPYTQVTISRPGKQRLLITVKR